MLLIDENGPTGGGGGELGVFKQEVEENDQHTQYRQGSLAKFVPTVGNFQASPPSPPATMHGPGQAINHAPSVRRGLIIKTNPIADDYKISKSVLGAG